MKIKYMAILVVLIVLLGVGGASAKSLYVIDNINANPTPISAYDIVGNQIVYQTTNTVPAFAGGAVGLGVDTDSAYLFVTYENSNLISIVNATTMTVPASSPVTAPGASNLAGVVVDQDAQKVYTMDRNTNTLYVYSWDSTGPTLSLDGTHSLTGVSLAHGIALDETNDLLYVGDRTTQVKIFNTGTWTPAGSFTVSQAAMGIAVDVANGYVYTGNAYPGYGSIGILSQYNLGTSTEATVNVGTLTGYSGDNAVGVAVDPSTGLVYVTTGNQGSGGSDRLLALNSALSLTDTTEDIGNPTGLCIPGTGISYNPLSFGKDDGLATTGASSQITYALSYTNTNPTPVTGVTITDTLPADVSFVSATGTYALSSGVITWDIGTLAPGETGSVTVTVQESSGVARTLTNDATIDSLETAQTTQSDDTEITTGSTGGGGNGGEIPEFPTIALPVVAILGLAFVMQRRKEK